MGGIDAQIEALEAEGRALDRAYVNALSLLWLNSDGTEAEARRLGELMRLDLDRVKVDRNSEYLIAGVLNAGRGVISRGPIAGAATGYDTLNRLAEGQVVMRKLTAWEGPIAVVPRSFDGFFASGEFPTFTLDGGLWGPYFDHVCRSAPLWDEMKNRVTGSVQRRKRLNPDQLLGVALPIPPFDVQVAVATALNAMRNGTSRLTAELAALRVVRADLLTALLSREITVGAAVDEFLKAA
jgi:type I restriction enzyme S subunit